ncbi:hypothetical protein, partial [Actinokineospora sp.]|uniref:hypothetical protein n=1 Tax=Actinokineospora sp. TaxID=1872133 RepID=UPI003D6AB0D8
SRQEVAMPPIIFLALALAAAAAVFVQIRWAQAKARARAQRAARIPLDADTASWLDTLRVKP